MKAVYWLVGAASLAVTSFSAIADYTIDDGVIRVSDAQDIVITFSGDLQAEALTHGGCKARGDDDEHDDNDHGRCRDRASRHQGLDLTELDKTVEQACLALTLGQFLKMENPHPNYPANVTLFVRNDGVALANRDVGKTISKMQKKGKLSKCLTTSGAFTLKENLEGFIAKHDNNLVNCPICWCARYASDVDMGSCLGSYDGYGVLDPMAIPPLFLGAEKFIDF